MSENVSVDRGFLGRLLEHLGEIRWLELPPLQKANNDQLKQELEAILKEE